MEEYKVAIGKNEEIVVNAGSFIEAAMKAAYGPGIWPIIIDDNRFKDTEVAVNMGNIVSLYKTRVTHTFDYSYTSGAMIEIINGRIVSLKYPTRYKLVFDPPVEIKQTEDKLSISYEELDIHLEAEKHFALLYNFCEQVDGLFNANDLMLDDIGKNLKRMRVHEE